MNQIPASSLNVLDSSGLKSQDQWLQAAQAQQNYQNFPQSPQPVGALTSRIQAAAVSAERNEMRIRLVLRNLRGPTPEPGALTGASLNAVRTTIEEHITKHENHQGAIDTLLTELEGLI